MYSLDFLFFSWAVSLIYPYFSCLPKTRSHLFLQVYADLHKSKKYLFHLHFEHKKIKKIFPRLYKYYQVPLEADYVFWFQMYQQKQIKGNFHPRGMYNR